MKYKNELSKRLLSFAVDVIQFVRKLPKQAEYNIIRYQLIKSVTSSGANYQEAQSAYSLADFRNKVHIALKEISETTYWLTIISQIIESENKQGGLKALLNESKELENILGSIVKKTKLSKNKNT